MQNFHISEVAILVREKVNFCNNNTGNEQKVLEENDFFSRRYSWNISVCTVFGSDVCEI